jgi:hypothetical protein
MLYSSYMRHPLIVQQMKAVPGYAAISYNRCHNPSPLTILTTTTSWSFPTTPLRSSNRALLARSLHPSAWIESRCYGIQSSSSTWASSATSSASNLIHTSTALSTVRRSSTRNAGLSKIVIRGLRCLYTCQTLRSRIEIKAYQGNITGGYSGCAIWSSGNARRLCLRLRHLSAKNFGFHLLRWFRLR